MRWAAAVALAAPLAAAVAGVPEPGPASGLATLSLTTQNDLFASGQGDRDDFRTAGLDTAWSSGRYVLSGAWSMLTDRQSGSRSDQALFLAGLEGARSWAGGWRAAGFAGAGIQLDQRLAGQGAQNVVHRIVGASPVDLAYDDPRGARGALAASASLGWHDERWALELVGAGEAVESGEVVGEIGPRLCLLADGGALWLGPRWRGHDGDPGSGTAARTLDHEDGLGVDLGAWIAPGSWLGHPCGWQARAGYNLITHASSGSIGLLLRPGESPSGVRTILIDHDLAWYGGGGMGVQLRVAPATAPSSGWYGTGLLDYRFGTDPDGRLAWGLGAGDRVTAHVRHDQVAAGGEGGWRTAWDGRLQLAAAVQALAGVRSEGVVAEVPGAQRLEGRATAPVAAGSAAIRLEIDRVFMLGFSLDGWLPAWSETLAMPGGGQVGLNRPGATWGLHAGGRLAW